MITVDGDTAVLVGKAAVTVAIGGGTGTWNLESTMHRHSISAARQ